MSDVDKTEAALERERLRKQRAAKQRSEQLRTVKAACECFGTDSGKRVLLWLMDQCGFVDNHIPVDQQTGAVIKENIVYNEARRALYLDIRKLLASRPDILSEVEIYQLKTQGE